MSKVMDRIRANRCPYCGGTYSTELTCRGPRTPDGRNSCPNMRVHEEMVAAATADEPDDPVSVVTEAPEPPAPAVSPGHPVQPIVYEGEGEEAVIRFKRNAIVDFLLDWAKDRGMGLNDLARLPGPHPTYGGAFPDDDWQQLAQLIGYSVGGYGDLSYSDPKVAEEAQKEATRMFNERRRERLGPSRPKAPPEGRWA